ncbi:hypothetical protein GCM10009525_41290 [Streptosporangium amethystogenes subsp. fukuiense]
MRPLLSKEELLRAPTAHFVKSFTNQREQLPDPWFGSGHVRLIADGLGAGCRSKVLRSDVNLEIVSHAQYTQEVWEKVLPEMDVGCVTQ